jgi:hypothetical protein
MNSIGRVNLDGSDPQPDFIPNAAPVGFSPTAVAVDDSYIYWTTGGRYIGRANLDGTGVDPTYIDTGVTSSPDAIAVDNAYIYYLNAATKPGVYYVPKFGQLTGTLLVGFLPVTEGTALAVQDPYVYWGIFDTAGNHIGRVRVDGGGGTDYDFVPGVTRVGALAVLGNELYWTDQTHDTIDATELNAAGPGPIQTLAHTPGAPGGVAVDSLIDPTQTAVSCQPQSTPTGVATACTATVTDSTTGVSPTGTAAFATPGGAFFSSSPCTLTPRGGGSASCAVGVTATIAGTPSITAVYSGDSLHQSSSGTASICAGPQCTSPPASVRCVVPKLRGQSLAQARRLLRAAHCTLGKITRPRVTAAHKRSRLVVGSSKPTAGATLPAGSKVNLILARPSKRHRRAVEDAGRPINRR